MSPQPLGDQERLDKIFEALDRMNELAATHTVLVEGVKDIAALKNSGVEAQFYCVQSGGGPVRAAEALWKPGRSAVILTDWDRRGNSLAEDLRANLSSLGVRFDEEIRSDLAFLCRPYAKDVESLDSVILRLQKQILEEQRGNRMRGKIVVIEGIDGSGKSTACSRLGEILSERGFSIVVTAEPTHERIGALIRSGSIPGISQATEALLFAADRSDHTEAMERWAEEGKVVICDRYFASTVAYQSSGLDGSEVDRDWLLSINRRFADRPDLTILLDLDPEVSLARVSARGEGESKFEKLGFLGRVREEYLRLAEEFGFTVIDASGSPESVAREVAAKVEEVLRCIRRKRYSARRAAS